MIKVLHRNKRQEFQKGTKFDLDSRIAKSRMLSGGAARTVVGARVSPDFSYLAHQYLVRHQIFVKNV